MNSLPRVRIPPSPPETQKAPNGAFCVSGGEGGVDEPSRFDKFARSEFGQPQAGPGAHSAEGFDPWMGRTIPADVMQTALRTTWGLLRFWRRGRCGRTLPVIRPILGLTLRAIGCADVRSGILPPQSTNSPGANLDSRRLAPQREARRGLAHGWAKQSLPLRQPRTSFDSAALRSGRTDF